MKERVWSPHPTLFNKGGEGEKPTHSKGLFGHNYNFQQPFWLKAFCLQ
jgi:hypothetical protein